jgi:hypothetical protein
MSGMPAGASVIRQGGDHCLEENEGAWEAKHE